MQNEPIADQNPLNVAFDFPSVIVADRLEDLSAVHRPNCGAVIWDRRTSPDFQRWIDEIDPDALPRARMIVRPDEVRSALVDVCDASGAPDGPERERFIDDIVSLTACFTDTMRAPHVRVRLDVVTTNACRRFHIDAVVARLICTYRGVGTQFGEAADGVEPPRIATAPTGAPIVLRGARWTGGSPLDLRHRSPPIEGTGATRLVLVLDPIFDREDAVA